MQEAHLAATASLGNLPAWSEDTHQYSWVKTHNWDNVLIFVTKVAIAATNLNTMKVLCNNTIVGPLIDGVHRG